LFTTTAKIKAGHRADLVSHFSPGSDLVVNKVTIWVCHIVVSLNNDLAVDVQGYPRRDFEALTANY
jgi:hypothetical protein